MNREIRLPIGVLVMAYGGPESLDEVPGYLAGIREGRVTSSKVLREITANYRAIGGRSPLLEISRRQMDGVAARLAKEQYRCYLGMRHWAPWIEEVVGTMIEDGVTHAVSLVLAPHYSRLSIAKYQEAIRRGLLMYRGAITFQHIQSYHDSEPLIVALADRVRHGLDRWPQQERGKVHVVFSAHSLPTRILDMGDPYDSQLHETARLVAERVGLGADRWSWSYQSAGRSLEPWLGPAIEDHLAELAKRGVRDVIALPIGFVSDHVEILHDIDIAARALADELGMRLERPPALNDDPRFIDTLYQQVTQAAAAWAENDTSAASRGPE